MRVKIREDRPRHLEGSPDPVRDRVRFLDLDLLHAVLAVEEDGVEQLGAFDGKEEKRELPIRKVPQRVVGEPDGIRETDEHLLGGCDERQRREDRIAQPGGMRLDAVEGAR